MRRIVILGNGIAGSTVARHVRKRCGDPVMMVSGETLEFFSRTALMYIYMGHMRYRDTCPYEPTFWADNQIQLLQAWATRLDPERRILALDDGSDMPYEVLVLATGSRSNRFGWPGQDLPGVQGLYSYPDLEEMERNTAGIERGVVVGGGLIGVEVAEMLRSRGIEVTMLVREAGWMDFAFPPEESSMIGSQVVEHGVDLRLGTELDRIVAGPDGRVSQVVTRAGETIPCGFVALTVGVSPNVQFLEGSGLEIDRGILVDEQLRTNLPDVFAVGDCAQLRSPPSGRRPIEPVWYTGRQMGEAVAATITGDETRYDPGIWFNSAKFFDLEWQIYGDVPAVPGDGDESLFWRAADGRKSIRIAYRGDDLSVTGFQLLGVRYRQETCHDWIRARTPLPELLPDLGAANFDPEFAPQHEGELIETYNDRHPDRPVRQKRRRGLWRLA